MIGVSAIMIAYNNEEAALTRLHRDLLPALKGFDAELIVIDNSERRCEKLLQAVRDVARPGTEVNHVHHRWQPENPMYGPSLNTAVTLATRPYLLYVCTNHGFARDPSWAMDLLTPLVADDTRTVAMTGSLQDAGPPEEQGFPATLPHIHVQGGVFAARRDVLRAFPYPDGEYAHFGADLHVCFALLNAGFKLIDVPTVRSVWRTGAGDGQWKYVHDEP